MNDLVKIEINSPNHKNVNVVVSTTVDNVATLLPKLFNAFESPAKRVTTRDSVSVRQVGETPVVVTTRGRGRPAGVRNMNRENFESYVRNSTTPFSAVQAIKEMNVHAKHLRGLYRYINQAINEGWLVRTDRGIYSLVK